MIKAALFDLDGTLIDAMPDLTCGINAMLARNGLSGLSEKEVSNMVGKGAGLLVRRAFAARGRYPDEQTLQNELNAYCEWMVKNGAKHSVVFPGVVDGLKACQEAGIKVALVTNKPVNMTRSALRELGLERSFDVVVAAGDAPTVKPEPEMLLLACQKLGVNPGDAVMVGDSGNDALAARNARMRSILLSTGYNEGEPIESWAKEHGFDAPYGAIVEVFERLIREQSMSLSE